MYAHFCFSVHNHSFGYTNYPKQYRGNLRLITEDKGLVSAGGVVVDNTTNYAHACTHSDPSSLIITPNRTEMPQISNDNTRNSLHSRLDSKLNARLADALYKRTSSLAPMTLDAHGHSWRQCGAHLHAFCTRNNVMLLYDVLCCVV